MPCPSMPPTQKEMIEEFALRVEEYEAQQRAAAAVAVSAAEEPVNSVEDAVEATERSLGGSFARFFPNPGSMGGQNRSLEAFRHPATVGGGGAAASGGDAETHRTRRPGTMPQAKQQTIVFFHLIGDHW